MPGTVLSFLLRKNLKTGVLSISLSALSAVLATGCYPVGLQGRSALPVGDTCALCAQLPEPDCKSGRVAHKVCNPQGCRPACLQNGRLPPRFAFEDHKKYKPCTFKAAGFPLPHLTPGKISVHHSFCAKRGNSSARPPHAAVTLSGPTLSVRAPASETTPAGSTSTPQARVSSVLSSKSSERDGPA